VNKLLTPEEFDKRITELNERDPDLVTAIAAAEILFSLNRAKIIKEKEIAKNKLKYLIYTNAVLLIFLFLKATGHDISEGQIFILSSIIFAWHLYVV
jgi:hypothetical protein